MLVIRHCDDDKELLKGLCVFLNSPSAAEQILKRRPSVQYRDSYPKLSGKDINALIEDALPEEATLRTMAREYGKAVGNDASSSRKTQPLIEYDFPVESISASCSREKSTRHGHISTLQLWWARRPLAVCRSAIFAALMPGPEAISPEFDRAVHELIPGQGSSTEKLLGFTRELAEWEACKNEQRLEVARKLIAKRHEGSVRLVDTFAGGGSFPLEALRLGLDAYGSDLNPVAVAALKLSLELLPGLSEDTLAEFEQASELVLRRLRSFTSRLYEGADGEQVLAYFWCRTYCCPTCNFEVPLVRNRLLSSSGPAVIVEWAPNEERCRFEFSVTMDPSPKELKAADAGTVSGKGAVCPHCSTRVATSWLQKTSCNGQMGDRLYAKRIKTAGGDIRYEPCGPTEEAVSVTVRLRQVSNRSQNRVPDAELDINGVRHTWAMQYGVRRTSDLFNHRQGVALLEVAHEIQEALKAVGPREPREREAIAVLLALTLNRLVMYNSRHAWWQPNGEFPANMFVRQAIPMVWNYVEIPVDSPAAGGWSSAVQWLLRVAEHCRQLPRAGRAALADAAKCELPDGSVDLVTLDPPIMTPLSTPTWLMSSTCG